MNGLEKQIVEMEKARQRRIADDSKKEAKLLIKKIKKLNEKVESSKEALSILKEFWEILSGFHHQISQYQGFQGFEPEIYQDLKKSWEEVALLITQFLYDRGRFLGIRSWTLKYFPHSLISAFEITYGR